MSVSTEAARFGDGLAAGATDGRATRRAAPDRRAPAARGHALRSADRSPAGRQPGVGHALEAALRAGRAAGPASPLAAGPAQPPGSEPVAAAVPPLAAGRQGRRLRHRAVDPAADRRGDGVRVWDSL